ncbi:MAG: hypothetical protein WA160_04220 [Pseudobdellovibrio sp.]
MDMKNLVLRPNCLLTPSDLVFLPGPRSLFFYKKMFGDLPRFLYEHGYRTMLLSLPFRNKLRRSEVFKNWLNYQSSKSYHFILDEITFKELQLILESAQVRTITILTTNKDLISTYKSNDKIQVFLVPNSASASPLYYSAHRLINSLLKIETAPFETTFTATKSKTNKNTYNRFLDHCIKLAENELYA